MKEVNELMYAVGDYMEVLSMADDAENDEEMLKTIKDTLEGIEGDLELCADNVLKAIKNRAGLKDGLKAEIERLQGRLTSMEKGDTLMKKALEVMMRETGKTKFKTAFATYWMQKNPESVKIHEGVDINTLPAEYITFGKPKANLTAIKEAIKNGETFDFAHLEQTEGLRFR